jgi:hypothetical protein
MKKHFLILVCIFVALFSNAQCYMDQHSTTWYDSWTSCESKESPNPIRGNSHWILYNLGQKYALGETQWWNANEPKNLSNGFKNLVIDVSIDGKNWQQLTKFEIPQASGKNNYEGFLGPFLDKTPASYLLITALDNYGGDCFSFGEMKISVEILSDVDEDYQEYCTSINSYPNPFSAQTSIEIKSNCIQDNSSLTIEDVTGKVVYIQELFKTQEKIDFDGSNLSPGLYFIKAAGHVKKIIKID